MATSPLYNPNNTVVRDASDYLWSIDPSGQFMYGYSWDHCGNRPVNIYDVYGSGQCLDDHGEPSGAFKFYAREFVETCRAPVVRNPMRLAGPGYDIFGAAFGLVPASGHTVFMDGVPIINWQHPETMMSGWISAPVDLRYDLVRGVWSSPYNAFLAQITSIAAIGTAFRPDSSVTISTLPVRNYYSVESGLYRYRARPYIIPGNDMGDVNNGNYPTFSLLNVAELNGDFAYLRSTTPVMVIKNPSPLSSGTYLCNERPCSWAAFV